MFRKNTWSLTGASGTEYTFTIHRKADGLPESPGVFILAYTHLRGHMAGWQVNPLRVAHSENMSTTLVNEMGLAPDQTHLWNSNFVLLIDSPSVREACARDLEACGTKNGWVVTA